MTKNQQVSIQQIFEKAHTSQDHLSQILQIGRKKGFSNLINRRLIWPFLMGLDEKKIKQKQLYQWKCKDNKKAQNYDSIIKDSQRSLYNLKTYESASKYHLITKQEAVLEVLNNIFLKNPSLMYIQGFHEVVSVVLTIFDNNLGYYISQKLAKTYFYDFLTIQTSKMITIASEIIFQIVTIQDVNFKQLFMYYHDTKILMFVLPWILTWFSHTFRDIKTIARIWDYLLCTGPFGIFYLSSAIILETKVQLISNCQQSNQASTQLFYQEYFKAIDLDIQQIIKKAIKLQEKTNITQLSSYQMLQKKSNLRLQNFYSEISIHKHYHESKIKQKKRQGSLKSAALIGGAAILMIGAALIFKRKVNFNQFKQL